ncbi:MAG: diphthine--ammonia ligase [Chloroherpetonaceae bacterium]|nr:diphthine--ammonia ligase [Chloroherpetonaceae bacterium]MDW8438197.1 diphthine--ammonia ligase [Chloroherpetonaceae bacterium]
MPRKKTYFNWSSGKDSARALYELLKSDEHRVERLLTTVNAAYDRVSMHGLRRALLEEQIKAIGIPNLVVELPEKPTNALYESAMRQAVESLRREGFECAAFGDIFLEDLRQYRERQLEPLGMRAIFPIWKRDSKTLIEEFIDLGFKAVVICANADLLEREFLGREIDKNFLNDLPKNIDPCGENGEFHTFCFDAPYFKFAVEFSIGEVVLREYDCDGDKSRFWFCDLIPKSDEQGQT